MKIEIKFLDTKNNIVSLNEGHMVRYVPNWYNMEEKVFLRVLESVYELEAMHSDNWGSFTDAAGEEIGRYIKKNINHLTLIFPVWYLPEEIKKTYIDIYNFFFENTLKFREENPNSKIEFTETLVFPIENKEEIIKMAKDNNFEYFLKAIVD